MSRQCRQLYAQDNTLIRQFQMCSIDERKKTMFTTFGSHMCTAHNHGIFITMQLENYMCLTTIYCEWC